MDPVATPAKTLEDETFDAMTGGIGKKTPPEGGQPDPAPADPPPADPPPADPPPADPPPADPPPADPAPTPTSSKELFGDNPFDQGTPAPDPEPDPAAPPAKKTDEQIIAEFEKEEEFKGLDVGNAPGNYKKSLIDIKTQRDEARGDLTQRDKQIEQLNAQLAERPTKEAHETLQTQHTEATNRLGYFDVEATPKFQEQVTNPKANNIVTLKNVGQQYAIEEAEVDKMVGMNAKQRMEYAKEKYPDYLEHVRSQFAVLDRIEVLDAQLRADHPNLLKEARANNQQAAEQQNVDRQNLLDQSVSQAVEAVKAKKIPYFMEFEGDDDHNAEVKKTMELAKRIPHMDMKQILQLAVIGASASSYHEFSRKTMAKNDELQTELDRLTDLQPGSEGNPPAPGSPTRKAGEKVGFKDYVGDLIDDENAKASVK